MEAKFETTDLALWSAQLRASRIKHITRLVKPEFQGFPCGRQSTTTVSQHFQKQNRLRLSVEKQRSPSAKVYRPSIWINRNSNIFSDIQMIRADSASISLMTPPVGVFVWFKVCWLGNLRDTLGIVCRGVLKLSKQCHSLDRRQWTPVQTSSVSSFLAIQNLIRKWIHAARRWFQFTHT